MVRQILQFIWRCLFVKGGIGAATAQGAVITLAIAIGKFPPADELKNFAYLVGWLIGVIYGIISSISAWTAQSSNPQGSRRSRVRSLSSICSLRMPRRPRIPGRRGESASSDKAPGPQALDPQKPPNGSTAAAGCSDGEKS